MCHFFSLRRFFIYANEQRHKILYVSKQLHIKYGSEFSLLILFAEYMYFKPASPVEGNTNDLFIYLIDRSSMIKAYFKLL